VTQSSQEQLIIKTSSSGKLNIINIFNPDNSSEQHLKIPLFVTEMCPQHKALKLFLGAFAKR
jgi:hypothetical protein